MVGSYHVVKIEGHDVLLILFGEGDKYPCYETSRMDEVQWISFENITREVEDLDQLLVLPKASFSLA